MAVNLNTQRAALTLHVKVPHPPYGELQGLAPEVNGLTPQALPEGIANAKAHFKGNGTLVLDVYYNKDQVGGSPLLNGLLIKNVGFGAIYPTGHTSSPDFDAVSTASPKQKRIDAKFDALPKANTTHGWKHAQVTLDPLGTAGVQSQGVVPFLVLKLSNDKVIQVPLKAFWGV